ncbi:site-2 protease family protein [Candidatus Uhrbacteria bacterium]|nr:site-2 protease family protein [Candidatus Uhrbacteria bacterium]
MFLSLLTSSPALAVVWLLAIVISLTVHEFAHALAGRSLGDPTAEREGRLTLNPAKHIDPLGFLLLLLVGFGWAKPVPFNPYALKNPVRDSVVIALAGPVANLILAGLAAIVFRAAVMSGAVSATSLLSPFLVLLMFVNSALALFNLIPIPPLDGSRLLEALFASLRWRRAAEMVANFGPRILFLLVLLSMFGGVNIFGFVGEAGFGLCSELAGQSCLGLLTILF